MECLDANVVAEWFAGDLSAHAARDVHQHVDRCEECRALYVELSRSLADSSSVSSGGGAAPIAVGDTIGRFVVFEWLGAGGMGVVYGAFDPELERRVAIKVLRPDNAAANADDVRERLLREAKALARVSHPNVIAIYDVGARGDELFIAMEYVRGQTIAAWLRAGPRSVREILDRFVDAGRGLAAAHARGLVHRDFKPSNVLLGKDGRVRVTDFGLARAVEGQPTGASPASPSWAGTPEYMAPEQRRGEPVDARADQYSFCVALHEALAGVLPGTKPANERRSLAVPTQIRAAVARGLSEDPSERFGSMTGLVSALARTPRSLLRRGAFAVAAIGCVVLSVLAFARTHVEPVNVCGGAERKLVGVWDDAKKQTVRAAFRSSSAPYADESFAVVASVLDDYAGRWTRAHRDACEATRVHGEQSAETMDLRVACLDEKASELRALTDVFAAADLKIVDGAVQAASSALARVDTCRDVVALRARARLAKDRPTSIEIDVARSVLVRAHALDLAGQSAESEALAATLRERARANEWLDMEAEAAYLVGRGKGKRGDFEGADAALYDAAAVAEGAGDDLDKARAFVQLTYNLGEKLARYDEAERVAELARAVLGRLPGEIELQAKLDDNVALIDVHRGRYPEGVARSERALAARIRAFGPDHVYVATSYNNLAKSLVANGQTAPALAYQERALATWRSALGPRHPSVALGLHNLSISELRLHRLTDGEAHVREAIAVWREAYGEEHPSLVAAEGVLATILRDANKPADALPHAERSLALVEKLLPADHPDHVSALDTVGQILVSLGRPRDAVALHLRALEICARLGNPRRETAETLTELGVAQLEANDARAAATTLERALAMRPAASTDAIDIAETRFALARALAAGKREAPRARSLAEQARAAYQATAGYEAARERTDRWLANAPR